MTHPSPTDLEEISAILAEAQAEAVKWNACCAALRAAILKYIKSNFTTATAGKAERELLEVGTLFYKDAGQNLLTHIAALEAELVDKGERIGHWVKRVEQLEAQLATSLPDDPETDGTDAAHPAWWRGQERGVDGAAQSILNVIAKGRADGTAGSKLLQQAREQVVALLSGATSAEQSFDGTIHPDGTPNQVTASTWLSGAATEEQPRLHRITCKYWNGWGPCDCGAGAATPAPIGGLTAQVLRLLDELDDDDLLPISRRHIIRTIQDLIKSTPTLQENTARHADGLDTHGGTGVGSASLSPVAPAPTAALTEEERNLLVFMADTNTALSFKERQRCREITYRLAAKSPPQGAEE